MLDEKDVETIRKVVQEEVTEALRNLLEGFRDAFKATALEGMYEVEEGSK